MKTSRLVGFGALWFGALWFGALAYGFWTVRRFESTPGAMTQTPAVWPATSSLPREEHRARLVMFVHPRCSCTRASLEELAEILKQMPDPVRASIVIEGQSAAPTAINVLEAEFARLTQVGTINDPEGTEGRLFGALTSGHTVFYDPMGRLRFSGGITGARGHVGDNWGVKRLVMAAMHPGLLAMSHGVYGCPL